MQPYQRPLVAIAVDLGPGSEDVARAGARIAETLGGQGVLLHSMLTAPAVSSYDRVVSRLDILSRTCGDLPFEVLSGAPALSINEWAESVDAAVIVVGARRNPSRIERSFATIDGLLRNASRLLWVIRPGQAFPPQHPLFAVGATEASDLAVEAGRGHLFDLGWTSDPVLVAAIDNAEQGVEAHSHLRRLCEENELSDSAIRIAHGRPLEVVEEHLRRERCDLLVAGSSVPRGWNRLRFGSVASELAYRAACHVLLIPEPAARCYAARGARPAPGSSKRAR